MSFSMYFSVKDDYVGWIESRLWGGGKEFDGREIIFSKV